MTIKKLLAILLALAMCFSLIACSADEDDDDDDDQGSKKNSSSKKDEDDESSGLFGKNEDDENDGDSNVEEIPEDPVPQFPDIDMTGVNVFQDVAEFSFVRAYHSAEVKSPDPLGRGTSFTASQEMPYLVLHLNVTNKTDKKVSVDDLMDVFFIFGEDGERAFFAAVEPDTNKLNRSYKVSPDETVLVYFMAKCDASYDFSDVVVAIEKENEVYQGRMDFSKEFAYVMETPSFAPGDTFTSNYNGNFSVTVEDVYMADSLYPPQAVGQYTYWEDDAETQYLIVKITAKNLDSKNLSYWNIVGASCEYNGTDKYEAFFVVEENGGQNLKLGGSGMMLAPEEENVMYFAMMIPNEFIGGPLEISMFVGRDLYVCSYPA